MRKKRIQKKIDKRGGRLRYKNARDPARLLHLLVWHRYQRTPAALYGAARAPGHFVIEVHRTWHEINSRKAALGARATIYHFS